MFNMFKNSFALLGLGFATFFQPLLADCEKIDADKVPGTYIADVTEQTIFDSAGNPVGTSFLGRMMMLLPHGFAQFAQSEWDTVSNTFPDPQSTVPSGLVQDNQQQPNFGTWVIENGKIRVMSFEYYFLSTTADLNNMSFKGTDRNTWLFSVDTSNGNKSPKGYKQLVTVKSTLVEIDPPNNPLNPNAPSAASFTRDSVVGLKFNRAPNFGTDLQ